MLVCTCKVEPRSAREVEQQWLEWCKFVVSHNRDNMEPSLVVVFENAIKGFEDSVIFLVG